MVTVNCTFSQQHHPPMPGPFCQPCPMLVIGSMAFHLPNWSGSSPSGPGVSLLIHYWLGVPLHAPPTPALNATIQLHPFGDHQVGCGGNRDRIIRHNAIAAQSAGLAPVKEMPSLISNFLSRPADVFLPTWSCGWLAALDIRTCDQSPPTTDWEKQHPLLATPCKLVLSASCLPTSRHAD